MSLNRNDVWVVMFIFNECDKDWISQRPTPLNMYHFTKVY